MAIQKHTGQTPPHFQNTLDGNQKRHLRNTIVATDVVLVTALI